jgi:hypothetical protein
MSTLQPPNCPVTASPATQPAVHPNNIQNHLNRTLPVSFDNSYKNPF